MKNLLANTPGDLSEENAMLEPELREMALDWNSKKRLQLAVKFSRWAEQLRESAHCMNPANAKAIEPPKIHKNFVMVNLASWQQQDLRTLSTEAGISLKDALRWALTQIHQDLKVYGKIARLTGLKGLDRARFFSNQRIRDN